MAGFIPANVGVEDMALGGGRIIGEGCHFIDLIAYLCNSSVDKIIMSSLGNDADVSTDNASLLLKMANGSNGVINYFSNGSKSYQKERIEIFSQNRTIIIDNFRKSAYFGFKKSKLSTAQDKGHYNQFNDFLTVIKSGGKELIPAASIFNTSKAAIKALASLEKGSWEKV